MPSVLCHPCGRLRVGIKGDGHFVNPKPRITDSETLSLQDGRYLKLTINANLTYVIDNPSFAGFQTQPSWLVK